MACSDLEYLVLTVAIESSPFDILRLSRPVEGGGATLVADNELATFVFARQTDHERPKLKL